MPKGKKEKPETEILAVSAASGTPVVTTKRIITTKPKKEEETIEEQESKRAAIARRIGKEDIGAKHAVELLFGPVLGSKLARIAGRGKKDDWRKVLEPIDAVIQCNKVLKTSPGGTSCYICNGEIPTDFKTLGTVHPLYPECEHILPVTSARIYLTLYMSSSMLKDDYFKPMLDLEYAWAHRICNQTKSNELFILEDNDKTIHSNDETIRQTLLKIKTAAQIWKKKKGSNDINLPTTIDVTSQQGIIKTTKINPIVDFLNNKNTKFGQTFMLLNRAAFFSDEQYLPKNLQEAIQKYRTLLPDSVAPSVSSDQAIEMNIKTIVADAVEEELPSWLAPYLETYNEENVLDKLFDIFKFDSDKLKENYKGTVLETAVQSVFKQEYTNTLTKAENITIGSLTTSDIGNLIIEYTEGFHLVLYRTMLEIIEKNANMKNDQSLYCQTLFKVATLTKTRSSSSSSSFSTPTILNNDFETCDAWIKQRQEDEDKKKEKPDTAITSDYTGEEVFFDEEDEATQKLYEINALLEDLKVPGLDKEAKDKINDRIDKLKIRLSAIHTRNARIVASILGDTSSGSSSAASPYASAGQPHTLYNSMAYTSSSMNVEHQGTTSSSSTYNTPSSLTGKPTSGKGRRKTRRAKLFPRTRLTHRSGRSKKLKTRSSRKSRKGKSKKTTRY